MNSRPHIIIMEDLSDIELTPEQEEKLREWYESNERTNFMKASQGEPQIIDDFKPLPSNPPAKPNVKDFDDECNWSQHPTNPAIEINTITGRMRTKDFSKPGNYPKSI